MVLRVLCGTGSLSVVEGGGFEIFLLSLFLPFFLEWERWDAGWVVDGFKRRRRLGVDDGRRELGHGSVLWLSSRGSFDAGRNGITYASRFK